MKTSTAAGAAVGLAAVALLPWLERRRPLRAVRETPWRRDLRNLAVAAVSAATLSVLQRPFAEPLARTVERRRWGLAQQLPLPAWGRDAVAVLLMDYGLYAWHVLLHRSGALWRFHRVHHADLDLSASTALRFHFGELAASAPWRLAQIALFGTGPRALRIWSRLLFASIVFHHSNLRLPRGLERRLGVLIMTPRLHGLHHSTDKREADSNWSSGLTLWDRLHGTWAPDPAQPAELGVKDLRRPDQLGFAGLMAMPFERRSPRAYCGEPEGSRGAVSETTGAPTLPRA
ncbi:MAG: sterol desaturase family protein, partial [Pseudomonadota bacterium]|nr:sterol desaturase family protein [Pseudomonadota bacterium]